MLRDLDVLRELSTGEVNLAEIAKKYRVSKQAVFKHIMRLVKKGLVVKSSRGRYVLSDRGRALLEYAPRTRVEDVDCIVETLDGGIDYFMRGSDKATSEDLKKHFIIYTLHTLTVMSIAAAANASLEVNEKNVEDRLEALWRDWFKPILARLVAVMLLSSEAEWRIIEAFFNVMKTQGLVHASILDKYLNSSRKLGEVDSGKP
uniref:MarR family transcriptional regulator n=1 Tax=Thermogladius calderae TaxID=1200300 RepID=A0A7J3XX86_9CREN